MNSRTKSIWPSYSDDDSNGDDDDDSSGNDNHSDNGVTDIYNRSYS